MTTSASALSYPDSSFPLIQRPHPERASAAAVAGRKQTGERWLGKYREIIIAVLFFLVFDLAVLALNFYVSFQIGADAVSINVTGRQRMLSQRTAKALFSLEAALAKNEAPGPDLAELKQASELFDTALRGFAYGGVVPGGDGKPVLVQRIADPNSRQILEQAQRVWEPWQASIEPLLLPGAAPDAAKVSAAARMARASNLDLLRLMNALTTRLEADAAQRAATLRWVQTGGIVLALLNFLFILFKFIRRLRQSDLAVEQAGEENREILASVREGLFLLTPDGRLGSQISRSVDELFGMRVQPGERFLDVLGPLVSDKTLNDTTSYVDLLFAPHVKEQLIQSINPLNEVETKVMNRLGERQSRYLSFKFNRVVEDGRVLRLLVTVQDVSARVAVEGKLADERRRAQHEFDFLLRAFEIDRDTLTQFVGSAEARLLDVNDRLRSISSASGHKQVAKVVEAIYRHVHAIKGEASMFQLDLLAQGAHDFETLLDPLRSGRSSNGQSGDALLSLPLPLEDLLNRVQALKQLAQRVPRQQESANADTLGPALADLAQRIAADTGKRVVASARLDAMAGLPARAREALSAIAAQLVRNAVTHGIETQDQRSVANKPADGHVAITLERDTATGDTRLTVEDDGAGLSVDKIKTRLIDLGWYTAEQLADMSAQQVVSHIFKPGFSSAEQISEHAGRGIGLDVVLAHARQLAGRVQVSSRPGAGCSFRVCFGSE